MRLGLYWIFPSSLNLFSNVTHKYLSQIKLWFSFPFSYTHIDFRAHCSTQLYVDIVLMKKDIFLLHDKIFLSCYFCMVCDDVSQCDLDLQSFSPNQIVSTATCDCICRAIAHLCLKNWRLLYFWWCHNAINNGLSSFQREMCENLHDSLI